MALPPSLYRYRLSVEELVLILYTINCGKTAEAMLKRAYDDTPDDQRSTLLTAARNSLLARNYAHLVEHDFPQIAPEIQKTVFPLSSFSTLIELYDERPEGGFYLQLFYHPDYGFTLQQNDSNIVFGLTYATKSNLLGSVLAELFDHVSGGESADPVAKEHLNFSLQDLERWLSTEEAVIVKELEAKSMPGPEAESFSFDLANLLGFGTISFSALDFNSYIANEIYPIDQTFVYVEGAKNTWVVVFSGDMDKPVLLKQVSAPEFQKMLAEIKR